MNLVREIIRLRERNISQRQISESLAVSRQVVKGYVVRFKESGLSSVQIEELSDSELLDRLGCGRNQRIDARYSVAEKFFPKMALELRRVGVTLMLLWEEYMRECTEAHYSYSRFCRHYRAWCKGSELDMHIEHKSGDKLFVDFAGKKLALTNPVTGERKEVEVFVAILGASQLTYVEAVASQKKEDFIRVNANTFHYIGGVTSAVVSDCLKSAVTKGDKYEPDLNPDYAAFARYHETTLLPARPNHPKDKALVEGAVKLVYQQIYARMRDEVYGNLEELNQRIHELLDVYNNKTMQKVKMSRRQFFEQIERAALKPLPVEPYRPPKFATAAVQMNYHVYLREDEHYYSVPYRLKGLQIRFIFTDTAVEIMHDHQRVAIYIRDRTANGYTTNPDHMPSHHRFVADWSPDRISGWADKIGDQVRTLCVRIMNSRSHPEQAFKSCIGIIALAKKYDRERVNKASGRALSFGNHSYRAVKNILEKKLDLMEEEQSNLFAQLPAHDNVRGPSYYGSTGSPAIKGEQE